MRQHIIVVCAYGPADVTVAAAHRARRLAGRDGQVHLVAAHSGARAAYGAVPANVAKATPGHGVAAANALLAGLDGPILFIHDDVLITTESLAALARSHQGGVTVPWTNDASSDHHVGGLPSVRAGADQLRAAQRGVSLAAAEATRYRPSCLYAESSVLHGLLEHHITAAGTLVESAVARATVAAGAIATHDSSCIRQLLGPEGRDGRPLLVATLIVKDEEEMLPGCLESLDGLVDRVEICDTGSSDATIEIARSYGAHVIQREWRNDFGWARNEGLSQCQDAWFALVLDADERVVCDDPVTLRRRLATAAGEGRAYRIAVANVEDVGPGKTAMSWMTSSRIFSPNDVCYAGALHEQPAPRDPAASLHWSLLEGLALEHHGYRLETFKQRNKADRNIQISRAAYERAPSAETALNLARSLATLGQQPQLQRRLYTEALADNTFSSSAGRASVLTRLAEVHLGLDELEEALARATEALELVPDDDMALAVHGNAARRLGRAELILRAAQRRREQPSVRQAFESEVAWGAARSREVEGLLALGRFDEAFAALEEILKVNADGFDGWPTLVESLAAAASDEALGLLIHLALVGGAGKCFTAVHQRWGADVACECCIAYLQAGGTDPAVVQLGLAAAMVAGRWDVFDAMSPAAVLLDTDTVERIVARAAERGAFDSAEILRQAVQATV